MHTLSTFLLLFCLFCDCCKKRSDTPVNLIDLPRTASGVSASGEGSLLDRVPEEEHNEAYWELFFKTRGASVVWKELKGIKKQKVRPSLHVELKSLEGSPTQEQIYQLTEGIIEFLFKNKIPVTTLVLVGDSTSEKRLHNLPTAISKLTTLVNLGLAHNALTDLPQTLNELPMLLKLEVRNNKLKTLPASLFNLCSRIGIDGKNNPWLDISNLRVIKKASIKTLLDKPLQELSDPVLDKPLVFFSHIWELSGERHLVPFKASTMEDISSMLKSLPEKPIYVL